MVDAVNLAQAGSSSKTSTASTTPAPPPPPSDKGTYWLNPATNTWVSVPQGGSVNTSTGQVSATQNTGMGSSTTLGNQSSPKGPVPVGMTRDEITGLLYKSQADLIADRTLRAQTYYDLAKQFNETKYTSYSDYVKGYMNLEIERQLLLGKKGQSLTATDYNRIQDNLTKYGVVQGLYAESQAYKTSLGVATNQQGWGIVQQLQKEGKIPASITPWSGKDPYAVVKQYYPDYLKTTSEWRKEGYNVLELGNTKYITPTTEKQAQLDRDYWIGKGLEYEEKAGALAPLVFFIRNPTWGVTSIATHTAGRENYLVALGQEKVETEQLYQQGSWGFFQYTQKSPFVVGAEIFFICEAMGVGYGYAQGGIMKLSATAIGQAGLTELAKDVMNIGSFSMFAMGTYSMLKSGLEVAKSNLPMYQKTDFALGTGLGLVGSLFGFKYGYGLTEPYRTNIKTQLETPQFQGYKTTVQYGKDYIINFNKDGSIQTVSNPIDKTFISEGPKDLSVPEESTKLYSYRVSDANIVGEGRLVWKTSGLYYDIPNLQHPSLITSSAKLTPSQMAGILNLDMDIKSLSIMPELRPIYKQGVTSDFISPTAEVPIRAQYDILELYTKVAIKESPIVEPTGISFQGGGRPSNMPIYGQAQVEKGLFDFLGIKGLEPQAPHVVAYNPDLPITKNMIVGGGLGDPIQLTPYGSLVGGGQKMLIEEPELFNTVGPSMNAPQGPIMVTPAVMSSIPIYGQIPAIAEANIFSFIPKLGIVPLTGNISGLSLLTRRIERQEPAQTPELKPLSLQGIIPMSMSAQAQSSAVMTLTTPQTQTQTITQPITQPISVTIGINKEELPPYPSIGGINIDLSNYDKKKKQRIITQRPLVRSTKGLIIPKADILSINRAEARTGRPIRLAVSPKTSAEYERAVQSRPFAWSYPKPKRGFNR